jgi:hypothetical protein
MSDKPVYVYEILEQAIRAAGGQGLCNPEIDCGCGLDDLVPCESDPSFCQIGFEVRCEKCGQVWYYATRNEDTKLCVDCQLEMEQEEQQ